MQLTTTLPRPRHFANLSAHGFHRVNYWEWGEPANPRVAVCVHGFARNGRDFDVLAEALAPTHRVLAVDMPGRGDSEWLRDAGDYAFPTYASTLATLIACAGVDRVDWIGTSMGGLFGMLLAAQPGTPIGRLVVNDVGPFIEPAALARIGSYVGQEPPFASFAELRSYVQKVSAPFGPLTDDQWTFVAATNARQEADGHWRLAYDPRIAVALRAAPALPDVWSAWDAIACPVLVLRGAESDLLSRPTAEAMRQRGPRARLVEFPGVGHAPMLFAREQVEPVLGFLAEERAPPNV